LLLTTAVDAEIVTTQAYEQTLLLTTAVDAEIVTTQAYEQTRLITTTVEEDPINTSIYEQTSLVNDKYTTHDQLFMNTETTSPNLFETTSLPYKQSSNHMDENVFVETTSLPYKQTSNHIPELNIKTQGPMTELITHKYNQSTILALFNKDNETDGNMVITINIAGVIYEPVYTHNPGIGISQSSSSVKTYPFWLDWRLDIILYWFIFFI
jgi:hypothetical protein